MTSTTAPTTSAAHRDAPVSTRLILARAVRSEWIKIRSLRSTWIGTATAVVVLVGFGAIAAAVSSDGSSGPSGPGGSSSDDPLSIVLAGSSFAVLVLGVIGCLAGAREFGSGMIGATVAAVPRRWQIVVAKAAVLIAVVVPIMAVAVVATFGVGMAVLSANDHPTVSLTGDGVIRSLIGMTYYLTAIALIGLALGLMMRSTAGSIAAMVAVILILPGVAEGVLPDSFGGVLQFLPSQAASGFTVAMSAGSSVLDPAAGALVLLAWTVIAVAGAVTAMTRRDT